MWVLVYNTETKQVFDLFEKTGEVYTNWNTFEAATRDECLAFIAASALWYQEPEPVE